MTVSARSETSAVLKPPAGSRFAALDGLRGVAMMMVIAIHLNLLGIGWIGLSSFFVLSGFLITRILFADIEGSDTLGECLKRFYIRRTLRVFPLYYAALLVLLLLAQVSDQVRSQTEGQMGYAFAYIFNLFILTDSHQATHILDHLWSLSVEEQFYLFWPLVVYGLGRRRLPWLLGAILIASPLVRWATAAFWPPPLPFDFVEPKKVFFAIYFATWSHLDAFAFGALLNYIRINPRPWWLGLSFLLSYLVAVPVQGWGVTSPNYYTLPMQLAYPLSLPKGLQYVWGYTLINFNCALLILVLCNRNGLQQFFAHPILDWLGKRSYAIYIIHYPLLWVMEPLWRGLMHWAGSGVFGTFLFIPLFLPLVLLLSHLAHLAIEAPMLRLKERFSSERKTAEPSASTPLRDPAG